MLNSLCLIQGQNVTERYKILVFPLGSTEHYDVTLSENVDLPFYNTRISLLRNKIYFKAFLKRHRIDKKIACFHDVTI